MRFMFSQNKHHYISKGILKSKCIQMIEMVHIKKEEQAKVYDLIRDGTYFNSGLVIITSIIIIILNHYYPVEFC